MSSSGNHARLVVLSHESRDWLSAIFRVAASYPLGRLAADIRPIILESRGWGGTGNSSGSRDHPNLQPRDLLTRDSMRRVNDRAFRFSKTLVTEEPRPFPIIKGVDYGLLNLLRLQYYLQYSFTIALAAGEAARRTSRPADRVLTSDPFTRRVVQDETARGNVDPNLIDHLLLGLGNTRELLGRTSLRLSSVHQRFKPSPADAESHRAELPTAEAKVLLISETTPMDQMFAAVELELSRTGCAPVLRVGYGTASPSEELPVGVRHLHLDHAGQATARSTRLSLRRWKTASRRLNGDNSAPELAHLQALKPFLSSLYRGNLPRQIAHAAEAERLLDNLQPSVVVVGNDHHWVGQVFVQLARLRDIPTLAVQDGIAYDAPPWWWATADVTATTGGALQAYLMDHGLEEDRCVVTGQPRYDELASRRGPRERSRARRLLEIEDDSFTVLFATQYGQSTDYIETVVDSILQLGNLRLALRPHPSQNSAFHHEIAARDPRISVYESANIIDLVCACDVLVAHNSTVIFEAGVLDRPVVIANFGDLPERLPYAELEVASVARDEDELKRHLNRIHTPSRSVDEFRGGADIDRHVGPMDGRAAERVAALIQIMATGRKRITRDLRRSLPATDRMRTGA